VATEHKNYQANVVTQSTPTAPIVTPAVTPPAVPQQFTPTVVAPVVPPQQQINPMQAPPTPGQTPAGEVPTIDAVRAVLAPLVKAGKEAQMQYLFKQFGAEKLTDIPAAKYTDLIAKAKLL
jgi:hypothetical protein